MTEQPRLVRVLELRRALPTTAAALIEELVDASWTVRRAVVDALAAGGEAVLPVLCQKLCTARDSEARIAGLVDALSTSSSDADALVLSLCDQENAAIVCDAAQILGRRESQRAVPKLCALTEHADDNVALAAVEALGRIGGREAVETLLRLAESRNFFRTFPAIDVLGRARDSRALATLLQLATEPLYASEAVRALGRLGDPSVVPALVRLLGHASGSMVCAIALALVSIHDAAEQRFGSGVSLERALMASPDLGDLRRDFALALKRADTAEQLALSQVLSWIGEESAVPALLDLLRGQPAVAQAAAASLKRLGSLAEPQLIEAVRTGTSEERRALVPILSGRLAALGALVACLGDDDATVRALSCDALAKTSNSSSVPAIFPLLADADARVGQAALAAIQSLGSAETRTLTLEAARSADARVRRAALRILGYFGYPEGLPALREAMHAADERIREAGIAGLPFIDDPLALPLLLEASRHDSARTRASAVRALGHAPTSEDARARLRQALSDSDAWVRYYACQSLGRLRDDTATEKIAGLLADPSGQVRVAAVEALAHLQGQRAFDVLCGALGSGDADLHRAALVALGISKRKEALPALSTALSSPDSSTRLVALSALSELGLAEALPAIAAATRDTDEGVRVAATGFLAARSDASATNALLGLLLEDPLNDSLIQALARPAPGRAQALSAALSHADDRAANALVASLSRMQSEDARGALRDALSSVNDDARRAAAAALIALRDPASSAALERAALADPDAEMRRICAAALSR